MSYAATYWDDPGKAFAGALAVLMHGFFLALLVFGVSWQQKEPEAMVVDLWNNLPPVAVPRPPAPQPEPEVKPTAPPPPLPQVQQRVESKPVVKPETKPEPTKVDIALKEKQDKQEKERKEQMQREQVEKERKTQQEQRERAAAAQAQAEADQKLRAAKEQEDATRRLQEQQAAAQAKLVGEYMARIQDRIKRRINKTPCVALGAAEAQIDVTVLPDGNVLGDPKIRKSSGSGPCDEAVAKAILLAQPLPVPPDPALFKQFRELNLKFRPNE